MAKWDEMGRKEKVIVSACLLGERCRYDGATKAHAGVIDYLCDKEVIPFCPEAPVLGTPRGRISVMSTPQGLRVLKDADGADVTDLLLAETEKVIQAHPHPDRIILKAKSPSCGTGTTPVLDSQGTLLHFGDGIAAQRLAAAFPSVMISDEALFDPAD